ncbi:TerD family protein, partial [Streptomyces sp. NPDC048606]|uniref:TerD family protein n=1 Tax=Streptomyces sp. NPDC048606 TaxID=3154726 RepID=UPI003420D511
MTRTSVELGKGGNHPLPGGPVVVTVDTSAAVDVSALLLTATGRVRDDADLVFFNHPQQDGVRVGGARVYADPDRIPAGIERVVCVASIDADRPGAVFDAASTPVVTVACGEREVRFAPPPAADGETVLLLVELYRRAGGWKVRAVGQGYATGLAGLATDFGITVDEAPAPGAGGARRARPPEPPRRGGRGRGELREG